MVAADDGNDGMDVFPMGMGHEVEVEALSAAMDSWIETDSGVIVDDTDEARKKAVGAACRELRGLADHGLILVPANAEGTEVYAMHWGSELVVHQIVKEIARRKKG